jgi:hypothetical protein
MEYCSTGIERMTRKLIHIIVLIFLSGIINICTAQGVSVHASIDRDKILIGEPIELKLEAKVPSGSSPLWFPLDTIPHFEFIDTGKIDSTVTQGSTTYRQVLSVTSFDSGRWVIPALSLQMNGRYYLTDSLPVSVAFSNFDPNQDYHDIKDILEVYNPAVQYINWVVAGITLISLIGFIYFLRKSRLPSRQVLTGYKELDPFTEAMESLELLRKEHLPEKGEVKLYYTRLNDVIRKFISRRMGYATMEKTNEELILQVKQTGLPHDELIKLAQVLRMSDVVKFAKYVPASEDNEQSMKTTASSVQLLNNLNASAV